MKKTAQFIFGTFTLLYSCQKVDSPQPITPTELLTGKKWQLQASTITSLGQATVDLYALMPSYTKDNFQQFILPDTFTDDEGATKFSPSTPQSQQGTWKLSTDNSHLIISYTSKTNTLIIDELTSTSLKTHYDQTQTGGNKATVSNTYISIP